MGSKTDTTDTDAMQPILGTPVYLQQVLNYLQYNSLGTLVVLLLAWPWPLA